MRKPTEWKKSLLHATQIASAHAMQPLKPRSPLGGFQRTWSVSTWDMGTGDVTPCQGCYLMKAKVTQEELLSSLGRRDPEFCTVRCAQRARKPPFSQHWSPRAPVSPGISKRLGLAQLLWQFLPALPLNGQKWIPYQTNEKYVPFVNLILCCFLGGPLEL